MQKKMKTRSSAKKRFEKVGKNKIKRSKAYRRHLLTKKSAKRKRDLRRIAYVDDTSKQAILRLLPY